MTLMASLLGRIIGILLLAVLTSAGWLYRERLADIWHGGRPPQEPLARPSRDGFTSASTKVRSLERVGTDSVLLSAGEMASLIDAGLDPSARVFLDSLGVALGDDDLHLAAVLLTSALPQNALGPLSTFLGKREPVTARGAVAVPRPGIAAWWVRDVTVRGFPLPEIVTRHLVEEELHGSGGALSVRIPVVVHDIRIRPGGVTLYRGVLRR